jgi:serine/threonine protein kinase
MIGDYIFSNALDHSKIAVGFHKDTKEKVAVKILKKSQMSPSELIRAKREVEIMMKLTSVEHPHIAKMLYWEETEDLLFIVLEYMSGGELLAYILKRGGLPEFEARKFFVQIVSAVKCLHDNHIVHRDIKHQNIMLDDKNNVKMIDFGLSNFVQEGVFRETFCGTPAYAAPEMILGRKYSGFEVDLWSLGVVLYSMLTGFFPFRTVGDIVEGKFVAPTEVSPDCVNLLQSMLTVDRASRIKLSGILHHPWIIRTLSPEEGHLLYGNNPAPRLAVFTAAPVPPTGYYFPSYPHSSHYMPPPSSISTPAFLPSVAKEEENTVYPTLYPDSTMLANAEVGAPLVEEDDMEMHFASDAERVEAQILHTYYTTDTADAAAAHGVPIVTPLPSQTPSNSSSEHVPSTPSVQTVAQSFLSMGINEQPASQSLSSSYSGINDAAAILASVQQQKHAVSNPPAATPVILYGSGSGGQTNALRVNLTPEQLAILQAAAQHSGTKQLAVLPYPSSTSSAPTSQPTSSLTTPATSPPTPPRSIGSGRKRRASAMNTPATLADSSLAPSQKAEEFARVLRPRNRRTSTI